MGDVIGKDVEGAISYPEVEKANTVEEEDPVIDFAEQIPQFVGSLCAMMKWLSKNIEYPVIAGENTKQGKVQVKFVVDKQGYISNINVVKGVFPALDKETVRVISMMSRWNPVRQNGKPVAVNYTIPVDFQLK